ncbi:hypothetical protein MLD38_029481 [Melastoma candidum]|uniref:Uncharacterized protein n=1 Tax=Melastoma candidum TaxID=119954 RepID=A0ACB9N498_9MYRT|nr:hypothetical protein MLD38_029481 [Melastoma candidum]
MIAPWHLFLGSMAKEAVEDWHRQWRNIRVGDVVKIEKDQFFPADLFLLSSSYEDDSSSGFKAEKHWLYIWVVIFTGHDSKVMQNATKSPSKRRRNREEDGPDHICPPRVLIGISL